MTTHATADLVAIGGNHWTSPDGAYEHIYLDKALWMPWVGLEIVTYNSGRVSHAWLDGQKVSNAEATRILDTVHKLYVDVATGQLAYRSLFDVYLRSMTVDELLERIRKGLDAAITAHHAAAVHRLTFPGTDRFGRAIPDLESTATGFPLTVAIIDHLRPHLYMPVLDVTVDLDSLTGSITRTKNGREVMPIEVTRL